MESPWNIDKNKFSQDASQKEKIKFVLGYGILAPSTHNTQPWLFKIKNSSIEIYFDQKLVLPQADPRGRDLYISMGCLVENILIAAGYFKILDRLEIVLKDDLVGEIFFKDEGNSYEYAELLDAITTRVNSRGLFKFDPIPQEIIRQISSLNNFDGVEVSLISDKTRILKFADLTARGLRIAHGKSSFRQEMAKWMHNSLSGAKEGLHGYSLRMPFLLSFIIPHLIKIMDLSPLLARLNYKSIASAPLVIVILSDDSNQETWLHIGRLVQRMMLFLNSQNIKTSIFVASIEIGELYKEIKSLLSISSEPQFLFCAGYMDFNQKHSPRHSLTEKLVKF